MIPLTKAPLLYPLPHTRYSGPSPCTQKTGWWLVFLFPLFFIVRAIFAAHLWPAPEHKHCFLRQIARGLFRFSRDSSTWVFNMPCTKTALLAELLAWIQQKVCVRRDTSSPYRRWDKELLVSTSASTSAVLLAAWLRMFHIPGKQSCSLREAQGPGPNLGCVGSAAAASLMPPSPVRAEGTAGLG